MRTARCIRKYLISTGTIEAGDEIDVYDEPGEHAYKFGRGNTIFYLPIENVHTWFVITGEMEEMTTSNTPSNKYAHEILDELELENDLEY